MAKLLADALLIWLALQAPVRIALDHLTRRCQDAAPALPNQTTGGPR